MHTDSILIENSLHSHTCQDYVITTPDMCVVSDGCSSSPKTDFGSRLLAQHAVNLEPTKSNFILNAIKSQAILLNLGLTEESLDATLLVGKVSNENLNVLICGDGVYFYKYKDSELFYFSIIEYTKNFPSYLRYKLNETTFSDYNNLHDNNKIITSYVYDLEYDILSETSNNKHPEDDKFFTTISRKVDGLELFGLASDGILSLGKKTPGNSIQIDKFYLLKSFFSAKNKKGEFLNRAWFGLSNQFNKELVETKTKNLLTDDLSIACFVF